MKPAPASPAPASPEGGDPVLPPVVPPVREHVPSVVWGAALPLAVYFIVRSHVRSDAEALIVAGCFSAGWILVQFARQRKVDLVGAVVLLGFLLGVASSSLLGGNTYVLKTRDAFLTAAFGAFCVATLLSDRRPAAFYVARHLSAGGDPDKMAAYDCLHELPGGRHTFRVLSAVWGVGLMVEAGTRLALADILPTGTFLAASPFVTATVVGTLLAFTVVFTRRAPFGPVPAPDSIREEPSQPVSKT